MRYFRSLFLLGVVMAVAGYGAGAAGWFLYWSAFSFMAVALAYAFTRPGVFGKRPDGTLNPFHLLPLLPYLLIVWGTWHATRFFSREDVFNEIAPGLFLGRRPLAAEIPGDVTLVLDLAGEFPAARGVAGRPGRYLSRPMLDGWVMPRPDFVDLVREAAAWNGPIYVHCAQGHGRSAMVAAGILAARGQADGPDNALARVRAARPGVSVNRQQRSYFAQAINDLNKES